jgi:hypothetical protein
MKKLAALFVVLAILAPAYAGNLTADQAKAHVGENATVCGLVVSVHSASGSKGMPTFVNLDKPYPNHIFTILIWGDDLPNFKENPAHWEGKKACVRGKIILYQDRPEIVAEAPSQITFPK